jgi:hypothetical protein
LRETVKCYSRVTRRNQSVFAIRRILDGRAVIGNLSANEAFQAVEKR